MSTIDKDKLTNYFDSLISLSNEDLMSKVKEYMDDETIEVFVDHLEEFYGIEDDEQLGMLAQIMISGFIAAKEMEN